MIRKEDELKKLVEDLYVCIKAGQKPETRNTELKREWYNLNKLVKDDAYKINVSKFIKEIAAMANNYGPWEGHLIIGLGEDGIITDSPLSKSGLKDEADLYSLVVSTVEKPIRFDSYEILTDIDGENKTVSVIVIPVSIDKPHVMREYFTEKNRFQNYIPVKKGTAVQSANRSDLDLMYYDKQNIILEYALDIIPIGTFNIMPAGLTVQIELPVVFENSGRKPIIISGGSLIILADKTQGRNEEIRFSFVSYRSITNQLTNIEILRRPIIVPSKNAVSFSCFFYNMDKTLFDKFVQQNFEYFILCTDVLGNNYESKKFRR